MQNIMQKILNNKIVSLIIVVVAVGGGFVYLNDDTKSTHETAPVVLGTLIQEVSVTGTVTPIKSANLAFERGGKIKGIYVDVGERVSVGTLLAETDNGEFYGGLLDAESNLKAEEARLLELNRGTRPEQLQVSKTKVESAKVLLEDSQRVIRDTIADAYTKSDDAIRNRVDSLFSNPRSSTPLFNFTISDSQLRIVVEQERRVAEELLLSWQGDIAVLLLAPDPSPQIIFAKKNLATIKIFIDHIALAVNSFTATGSLSQTTIDGYKSSIITARTNVNTAISALTSADQSIRSAEQALVLAQNNLSLEEAGSSEGQISVQEARVNQAKAKVITAEAQYGKTILRSPINGIVTKKDARVGEIVGTNQAVLSIITDQNLEIEVNIPETDVTKVSVGDTSVVTLDAYSEDIKFYANVVSIDPAATIIEGVPTYKTTLYFTKPDSRIKSGMTANIDINTEKRENVLSVPTRAISSDGDMKMVNVELADKTIKKVPIETGLRSSDGKTEIISGLTEGDRVITSTLP